MGRQIISTQGQGLASSSARKVAVICVIVAVVVLVAFFFLHNAAGSHAPQHRAAVERERGAA